jgi:glycosyltransferase involved in cell wall biosynthesis
LSLRIGIDARLVGYRRGGISTYIIRLAEALYGLEHHEDVVLYTGRKAPPLPGFRTQRLRTPPHHRLEQWLLPMELRRERLDVFHSPDFIPVFGLDVKRVITVHDLAFLRYPDTKDAASLGYYGQVARAVKEAGGIIAVSAATRDDLSELLGVAPERVRVIYHGVGDPFRPLSERAQIAAFCKERGLPDRFILWVGTIEPRKNLDVLLQALDLAWDRLPENGRTLVVAGEPGWRHEQTWEALQDLCGKGRAVLHGAADERELAMLHNAAWVFPFPSLYEGFGLPPLEAMACGTPVIASRTPALVEVLGEAAEFIDPGDSQALAEALVRLSLDTEEQGRRRDAGIRRAAEFRWEKTAADTLSYYEEVASA